MNKFNSANCRLQHWSIRAWCAITISIRTAHLSASDSLHKQNLCEPFKHINETNYGFSRVRSRTKHQIYLNFHLKRRTRWCNLMFIRDKQKLNTNDPHQLRWATFCQFVFLELNAERWLADSQRPHSTRLNNERLNICIDNDTDWSLIKKLYALSLNCISIAD